MTDNPATLDPMEAAREALWLTSTAHFLEQGHWPTAPKAKETLIAGLREAATALTSLAVERDGLKATRQKTVEELITTAPYLTLMGQFHAAQERAEAAECKLSALTAGGMVMVPVEPTEQEAVEMARAIQAADEGPCPEGDLDYADISSWGEHLARTAIRVRDKQRAAAPDKLVAVPVIGKTEG